MNIKIKVNKHKTRPITMNKDKYLYDDGIDFQGDIFSQPSQSKSANELPDPKAVQMILDTTHLKTKRPDPERIRANENLYNRHIEILNDDKKEDHWLEINERKIFAVCSDGYIRVGSRNPKQGNRSLDSSNAATNDTLNFLKHIPEAQWQWVDLHDSSGHPTLLIADAQFDGQAYCGGWLVKKINNGEEYIEVLFQSGRLGKDLTKDQIKAVTEVMTSVLQKAYGPIKIIVHQHYTVPTSQRFWKRTWKSTPPTNIAEEDKGNLAILQKYPNVLLGTQLLAAVEKAVRNHEHCSLKETKISFLHQHGDDGVKKNKLLLSQMKGIKEKSGNFCEMLVLLKKYFNDQPLCEGHKVKGEARKHPHSFISFLLQELAKNPLFVSMLTEITRCGSEDLRFNQIFTEDNLDFTSKAADKFRHDAFNYFKKIEILPEKILEDLAMQMITHKLQ